MKIYVKVGYIITSVIFLLYLMIPDHQFPSKLENSITSEEPADTEDINRRGYFTDMDREEIIKHYVLQRNKDPHFGISLPTYRLNYPPEEAQVIIRDQTRSTFLEEIVNPFRESIFVNGYKTEEGKDRIYVQDKEWSKKIIVKHVVSDKYARLIIGIISLFVIPVVYKSFLFSFRELGKEFSRIWNFR
jgi:hypothetical protein